MSAIDRARAEHDAAKDADYWDGYPGTDPAPKPAETTICTFCKHPQDQHGDYRCNVPLSPGSPISCKCPRKGPQR